MAFSHALSCRWDQVSQPVDKSMDYYQQVGAFHGFEVAHTKWIDLWAKWNLGRWEKMSTVVDEMLDDARRRNDLLRQRLTCSGFGGAAFLLGDRTDELQRLLEANQAVGCDSDQVQVLDALDWIASIQFQLYQGDYAGAWQRFESLDGELRRLPFARIQLFRVSRAMLGALTAIHNLAGDFQDIWRVRAAARILQLRQESLPYAEMLASFYDGLLHHRVAIQGRSESARGIARDHLAKARQQAIAFHLRPFQLAAEDLLSEIETGQSWGALMRRMNKQGVVRPEAFARLYTIADG
jgi:hypothetical protein